jgi:hypothetical protein
VLPDTRLTEKLMAHDPNTSADALSRGPRRSACAAQAREREQEWIRSLSVQERIAAALTMGARFSWLKPRPAKTPL